MQISNIKRQNHILKIKDFAYYFVILLFAFLFLNSNSVTAQAITYPIADLGSCRDAKECFLYCEVPANKPACWAYKTYGSESQVLGEEATTALTFPIADLGNCANTQECKAYCDKVENKNACLDFAKSHNLGQFKKLQDTLQKAQQTLGCPTIEACRAFCQVEANHQKCLDLVHAITPPRAQEEKANLLAHAKELLGCQSVEACRAFCQQPENKDKCRALISSESAHLKPDLKKPGIIHEVQKKLSCTTADECRKVCEMHPDQCPTFKKVLDRKNSTPSGEMHPRPSIFPPSGTPYPEVTQTTEPNQK